MSNHDTGADGPPLIVSMIDDIVVVDTPLRLDLESTEALVSTVAAATTCGQTVMLDLDPSGRCSPTAWPHATNSRDGATESGDEHSMSVLAAGRIEITTPDEVWTVDLTGRRLCRTHRRVDHRFVDRSHWSDIRSLWATSTRVTVLMDDGRYVSISPHAVSTTHQVVAVRSP